MKDGTPGPESDLRGAMRAMGQVVLHLHCPRHQRLVARRRRRLRRSEETFRKIFDASLDAMSIMDADTGRYIDVNPEFLRATGFTREEIIGKTGDELNQWANPEQRDEFQRAPHRKR